MSAIFATNLLTYPDQFDNAYWSKTRATITANTIAAPDGTLTADKLVIDTTAANTHYLYRSTLGSYVPGGNVMFSIVAKAAEMNEVYLQFSTTGGGIHRRSGR